MSPEPARFGFNPSENRISSFPSTIAGIAVLALLVINGVVLWPISEQLSFLLLALVGSLGIAYLAVFNWLIVPSPDYQQSYSWANAILTSIGLVVMTSLVPDRLDLYIGVLLILAVIGSAIHAGRGPSYLLIVLSTGFSLFARQSYITGLQVWTFHLGLAAIASIIVETMEQLKRQSKNHIRRLQTISDFSRKITSTLNTKQVMSLLNAAFQNAVEADTYFVGVREGNEMRLELVYDDGEYFENQRVSLDGSLSSWVLSNHQSLFLPDLRKEVELPGVRLVLLGKHKTSLCWMGVPMQNEDVNGIIAIGSYRPNAFGQGDLELLTSLAQHAAQALHNTYEHQAVELRAQLDSLTGVYNHGNFLRILQQQADEASLERQPLSLIMLDIDYFKAYNDSYGHLVGDEVLTTLCATIKQHIKSTDIVGRWGGEEFVISLPNTSAEQAGLVARRIRETMMSLTVRLDDHKTIPVPTISQGLAVFPREADTIVGLIHLADKRLYVAKKRGRDQIEPPDASQWELLLEKPAETIESE